MLCERCSKQAPCVSIFGLTDSGWHATQTGWTCDTCQVVSMTQYERFVPTAERLLAWAKRTSAEIREDATKVAQALLDLYKKRERKTTNQHGGTSCDESQQS